jgi:replicative DNA helicase
MTRGALSDVNYPSCGESERAVLAGILINASTIADVIDVLGNGRAGVFFYADHQAVYEAACALHRNREAIDIVTLGSELTRQHSASDKEWHVLLADMFTATPTSGNIRFHAKTVLEKWQLRSIIEAGQRAAMLAASGQCQPSIILGEMTEANNRIYEAAFRETAESTAEIASRVVDRYADYVKQGKRATLYPCGIPTIDACTYGWQPGDMVVVGARPSVGKTAFLLQCCIEAARAGRRALFFSAEMSREPVVERMMAAVEPGVLRDRIYSGFGARAELDKAALSMQTLCSLDINVYDRPYMTMDYIASVVRAERAKRADMLVTIDYLQLLSVEKPLRSRLEEVSRISASIKELAKEHAIPVVVGAQLNREAEDQPSGYQMKRNIRECDKVEHDSDLVVILHQESNDKKRQAVNVRYGGNVDFAAYTEITIAKHRNGRTMHAGLFFDKDRQRLHELGQEPQPSNTRPIPQPNIEDTYHETDYDEPASLHESEDDMPF